MTSPNKVRLTGLPAPGVVAGNTANNAANSADAGRSTLVAIDDRFHTPCGQRFDNAATDVLVQGLRDYSVGKQIAFKVDPCKVRAGPDKLVQLIETDEVWTGIKLETACHCRWNLHAVRAQGRAVGHRRDDDG